MKNEQPGDFADAEAAIRIRREVGPVLMTEEARQELVAQQYEAARIRAREYKALIEDGYRRDGIVGVMGRVSVPLGNRMAGVALRPGLEALIEALEEVVALLVEEEEAQPDPAGGSCTSCKQPFTVGGLGRVAFLGSRWCEACEAVSQLEADHDGA